MISILIFLLAIPLTVFNRIITVHAVVLIYDRNQQVIVNQLHYHQMSPKQDQSASTVRAANVRGASMGYAVSLSIFLLLLEVCHGEF